MTHSETAPPGNPARRVLVTGASGFVGRSVCRAFLDAGWSVHATTRRTGLPWGSGIRGFTVADGAAPLDWREALAGVELVVHCAARVHVMQEQSSDPLAEFRRANVDATVALARATHAAGARRFILLSTVGVHGASSGARPFRAGDAPAPHSAYAQSKLEAEAALQVCSQHSGLEFVCIRPPLVYGPAAPGNFGRLLGIVRRRLPLPLGAVHNLRSMVAVDNLASLILRCADHPAAAGRTFLVSDGEDISTTALLRRLAQASGHRASLIPLPATWLRTALRLTGHKAMAEQLIGTLQVDITETRQTLDWTPPLTVTQALVAAAAPETALG